MNTPDLTPLWLARLADSGYRLTAPRRAIVETLASSSRALGPIDLYDQCRQDHPGLGLVTVYRTLEKLAELGLVERVHLPDGCHRYLRTAEGHQHLLLCTTCGQVTYFEGDELDELFRRVSTGTGYTVDTHWLQLYGLCPHCQPAEVSK